MKINKFLASISLAGIASRWREIRNYWNLQALA
jgi:hypothetical protein